MSFPGPFNVSKWPLWKLMAFTVRFYYVSYGNSTITRRGAIRRPLENLEVYNYLHRQTFTIRKQAKSRRPFDLCSLVLNLRKCFKVVCNEGCKKMSGKYGENKTQTLQKKKVSNTKHRPKTK